MLKTKLIINNFILYRFWFYILPAIVFSSLFNVGNIQAQPEANGVVVTYCEITLDIISPFEAVETWTIQVKNNNKDEDLIYFDTIVKSNDFEITLDNAYDDNGKLYSKYLILPPIPKKIPDELNRNPDIRIYFHAPIIPGNSIKFSFVLHKFYLTPQFIWQLTPEFFYRYYGHLTMKIILPYDFIIERSSLGANIATNARQTVSCTYDNKGLYRGLFVEIENTNRASTVNDVVSTPKTSIPLSKDVKGLEIVTQFQEKPSLLTIICLIIVVTSLLIWFFLVFPRRKRKIAELALAQEIIKKKLDEWETDGYNIKNLRDKWRDNK